MPPIDLVLRLGLAAALAVSNSTPLVPQGPGNWGKDAHIVTEKVLRQGLKRTLEDDPDLKPRRNTTKDRKRRKQRAEKNDVEAQKRRLMFHMEYLEGETITAKTEYMF